MESFTIHTGRGVALRRGKVDTDQIIPAEYLKRVSRDGFGEGLFSAWRAADPDFVLNSESAAGATVLVAGPDFGIGSSREHAVWALMEYGFRVVIAESFGDIFRNNATQGGLLPVALPAAAVAALQDLVESSPQAEITVDLVGREVRAAAAAGAPPAITEAFAIDDYTRWRLMEGLDDISLTLRHSGEIAHYESDRMAWLPAVR